MDVEHILSGQHTPMTPSPPAVPIQLSEVGQQPPKAPQLEVSRGHEP
jgi:hypothetical protein